MDVTLNRRRRRWPERFLHSNYNDVTPTVLGGTLPFMTDTGVFGLSC